MFRSSVKAPPTQVLPGVNTLVKVAIVPPGARGLLGPGTPIGAGQAPLLHLPSRVEDIEQERQAPGHRARLYVAAPRYAGDLEGPEPGSPCRVIWPTPNGLFELPTRYQGRSVVGPAVRAWRLTVDGPVVRAQRRRYFRVPWVGPVTLEVTAEVSAAATAGGLPVGEPAGEPAPAATSVAVIESLQVLTGMTIDLSEGGLRVALPVPGLPIGTAIRVLLPVRDHVLVLPATTVWNRPSPAPVVRQIETGISFDDVEEHGDLLRQVVIEAQLKARRVGLR